MSLGVLNNLSALYAENNLNNTSNSLSKVLQELSSGSKINSGADDAAGLSLINGLKANSQALAQSQTNALEGVGLLQVADGALSQATCLLNRAVTLATETSNGTLNTAQDAAANQEYQSILSEVSNIGATTTYNDKKVFNSDTQIYTGDSSVAGTSIDSLNIRSLSSSSVGDTGGAISYTPATAGSSGSSSTVNYTAGADQGATFHDIYPTDDTTQFIQTDGIVGSNVNDVLTGTYAFNDGSTLHSYTMGQTYGGNLVDSLSTLATAIQTDDPSVSATAWNSGGGEAVIQLNQFPSWNLTFVSDSLVDTTTKFATGSLSGIGSGDTLSGTLKIHINGTDYSGPVSSAYGDNTGATLASAISGATGGLVKGTYNSSTGVISLVSTLSTSVSGMTVDSSGLTDASSSGYTPGIPATLGYSDSKGQDLSSTNLSNQANAQTALTAISAAISDVAAQDGYIGSQINTLNSVSQVLGTQQENVTAALNAVQATDYASATSEMSKFEILSQTGIAALAQANTMQQEVTKLLQ